MFTPRSTTGPETPAGPPPAGAGDPPPGDGAAWPEEPTLLGALARTGWDALLTHEGREPE